MKRRSATADSERNPWDRNIRVRPRQGRRKRSSEGPLSRVWCVANGEGRSMTSRSRWLLNRATVLSTALCLALGVLWVRSFICLDYYSLDLGDLRALTLVWDRGEMSLRYGLSMDYWRPVTTVHEWSFDAPFWILPAAAALLPTCRLARWLPVVLKTRRRFGPGNCQRCGYDMRATLERCPECGQDADATLR